MGDVHECPMCGLEAVPVWRALCRHCYPVVPWELRLSFTRAYRRRVFEQANWQEVMVRGREWWVENGKAHGE